MKTDELKMAKFLLDKLVREYPSIFREDGSVISASYVTGGANRKTTPTQAKNDIKLIRRLLMEVSKQL